MSIIQISKIQVRRGLQENLPQLSSAELGWSIDQRRLFIGNGALSEGAPSVGNTEILTQYTDILSVIQNYYYQGVESGYISQTTTYRTFQNVLDENRVSIRNFGAVGDGITDCTTAILQAITQVYPSSQSNNPRIRRVIFFPAGTYVVNAEIALPLYATLVGDGIDATIIQQKNAAARSVFTLMDSVGDISPLLSGSSVMPSVVEFGSMTIQNTTDNDVLFLDSANLVRCIDIKLKGSQANPTSAGTAKALVRLISNTASCYNIIFDRCVFNNATYAVVGNGDIYGVSIDKSYFTNLYQPVNLNGSANYPRAVRISNSVFDMVYTTAIVAYGYSSVTSAHNYYKNVANGFGTSPMAPVIYYECPENYSFSDLFDRSASNSAVYPKIQSIGTFWPNPATSTYNASGSLKVLPGTTDILFANSILANTSLTISSVNNTNAIIDYTLNNGSNVKVGTLRIAINNVSTNQFYYEDDFVEYPVGNFFTYGVNSPTATQLSFAAYGNSIVLVANTSTTSGNVTFKYNVRKFS